LPCSNWCCKVSLSNGIRCLWCRLLQGFPCCGPVCCNPNISATAMCSTSQWVVSCEPPDTCVAASPHNVATSGCPSSVTRCCQTCPATPALLSAGLHTPPTSRRGQRCNRISCSSQAAAGALTFQVSNKGTPSAPGAKTVSLPNIQSIKDLTSAMRRHKPKADGQKVSALVTLNVDLGGRNLEDPKRTRNLEIPAGLRLRLSNGALHLPNLVTLVVGPGAELELVGVDIKGRGRRDRGLITVEGAGASATLRQCTITGIRRSSSKPRDCAHGLLVAQGGSAVVQQCSVVRATDCGICVQGEGSTAAVSRTLVQQCDVDGFSVVSDGKLTVELSISLSNTCDGFYAGPKGSLVAGPGCRSERNGASDFGASRGGQLVAGEGCYAGGNKNNGYSSSNPGSLLQAGPGCIAEHNAGCGFQASNGARLSAGPGCIARHNGRAGFSVGFSMGSLCELAAEPGCHAEGNGKGEEDQWVQEAGSRLTRMSE
jgi:hypothetical protein